MLSRRVLPVCATPLGGESEACNLSDFRIVSEIRSSEVSSLHRVIHTQLNRTFAMRQILKQKLGEAFLTVELPRILAGVLKLQRTSGILPLRHYFEDESKIYLIEDFTLEGRLCDYLSKSTFDSKLATIVNSPADSKPHKGPSGREGPRSPSGSSSHFSADDLRSGAKSETRRILLED